MISEKRCKLSDYYAAFEMERSLTDIRLHELTGSSLGGARMGRYRLVELGIVRPLIENGALVTKAAEQVYQFIGGKLPEKYLIPRKKPTRKKSTRKVAPEAPRTVQDIIDSIRSDLAILEQATKANESIAQAVLALAPNLKG